MPLELIVLGLPAVALIVSDDALPGAILAGAIVVHYALSYDRIAWLVKR